MTPKAPQAPLYIGAGTVGLRIGARYWGTSNPRVCTGLFHQHVIMSSSSSPKVITPKVSTPFWSAQNGAPQNDGVEQVPISTVCVYTNNHVKTPPRIVRVCSGPCI